MGFDGNLTTPILPTLVNGEFKASMLASDRGLAYGDGLFETIAWRGDQLELIDLHLSRLFNSGNRLLFSIDIEQVKLDLNKFVGHLQRQGFSEGVIKYIITRGSGQRGYQMPECCQLTRVASYNQFPAYPKSRKTTGVELGISSIQLSRSSMLAGIKHLNRLEQVIARAECDRNNQVDALLCDEMGNVIEATASNLFLVKHGILLTPKLNFSGVNGIMRQYIMSDLAAVLRVDVKETELSLTQVFEADEVFICNSLIGIWPVKKIQDKCWSVGQLSKKLQRLLNQFLVC